MLRSVRACLVTCLTTALISAPWNDAFAGERETSTTDVQAQSPVAGLTSSKTFVTFGAGTATEATGTDGEIWNTALGLVPAEARLMRARQSVAQTNEPKLLLGVIAGGAIIAGVAMLAYGATSSCKSKHETDSPCDRYAVLGAMALSGGTVTLVVWALSKP